MKAIAVIVCSLLPLFGRAADHYVSAAGDNSTGADWTHAWSDVANITWSSVSAGDNIWIAGGTYGKLTFSKSGTLSNPIYIARVRSTNAVPAAAAGWSSAFDSKVVITLLNSAGGYGFWTLDGQISDGLCVTNNTVHTSGLNTIELGNYGFANNITLLNVEVDHAIQDTGGEVGGYGISGNFSAVTACSNLTLKYCDFHNMSTPMSLLCISPMTITHNKFHDNYNGGGGNHPNIGQFTGATNLTLAYNEIYNWQDECFMLDFTGAGDAPNGPVWVYGNLWHNPLLTRNARCMEAQYNTQGPVYFFNNTIVSNDWNVFNAGNGAAAWSSTCVSSNNIFFAVVSNANISFNGNHDYNLASGTNTLAEAHGITNAPTSIFVNYAAGNYQIVSTIGAGYPRNAGIYVGPTYANDFYGNPYNNPPSMGYAEYYTNGVVATASTATLTLSPSGSGTVTLWPAGKSTITLTKP